MCKVAFVDSKWNLNETQFYAGARRTVFDHKKEPKSHLERQTNSLRPVTICMMDDTMGTRYSEKFKKRLLIKPGVVRI